MGLGGGAVPRTARDALVSLPDKGGIAGVIGDQSEAVIPRAMVTVTNVDTGLRRVVITGSAGVVSEALATSAIGLLVAIPAVMRRCCVKKARRRERLWILWRYDWRAGEWKEIARALAYDWSWSLALTEPAIRALHPRSRDIVDATARGREVTEEILRSIDTALLVELPPVRLAVLTAIYDGMAGRIVAA
jgi:hypothetical protein